MSDALKRVLASEYAGAEIRTSFAIDQKADREEGTARDGTLCGWYTALSVEVDGINRLWLRIYGSSVPNSRDFVELVHRMTNRIEPGDIRILITVHDSNYLRDLAATIQAEGIQRVPGGKPWDHQEFLTAAALRRLARVLGDHVAELDRHGAPGPVRQQRLF